MLMRPHLRFQSSARQARAFSCFSRSARSSAYRSTLVSTKTLALMSLLAREIGTFRTQKRLASECLLHGALVLAVLDHLLFEYSSEKTVHAGIPTSRLYFCPTG